ncbi:MAG: carbohydrate kinase [Thiogranum sp.]|nr:carbohydrate kinase [Thiogranum sp.]
MHDKRQPFIFGEVLFDRFPDGSSVLGGAPFNVAWHLQAFGQSPLFISRVGDDDPGADIRAAMQRWGMSTEGLQLDSGRATGTVEVSIEHGEPRYDIVAGRSYDFINAAEIPPATPSLLYHGTLALRNTESAQALAELKKRCAVPVLLDVNLRPPWWQAQQLLQQLEEAHWVKLNEDELDILADSDAPLETKAPLFLQKHGIELLIVTRGSRGAVAFTLDGQSAKVHPRDDVKIVDTVGAGDAFTSVVILGLLLDWPLQQSLERAQSFASALVGVRGATVQNRNFYRPFIQRWELSAS